MRSPERNQPDVDARDLRICRYLDGSMPAEERAEFERQMLRDPSLNRETAAFAETDRQVADALSALLQPSAAPKGRTGGEHDRFGAGIRRFLAIAATLLIAVTAFVMIHTPKVPSAEQATSERSSALPEETDLAKAPASQMDSEGYARGRSRSGGAGRGGDTRLGPEESDFDGLLEADAEAQPTTFFAESAVACGDTPPPPATPTRDLAERLERERVRCGTTSSVHVSREYIGVVDEDRGEVYMIQLDRVASDAGHPEADL